MSEADEIEPSALVAIADALQEHIIGLTDAANEAHASLRGKARASAEGLEADRAA